MRAVTVRPLREYDAELTRRESAPPTLNWHLARLSVSAGPTLQVAPVQFCSFPSRADSSPWSEAYAVWPARLLSSSGSWRRSYSSLSPFAYSAYRNRGVRRATTVSYTHLTLPTILRV